MKIPIINNFIIEVLFSLIILVVFFLTCFSFESVIKVLLFRSLERRFHRNSSKGTDKKNVYFWGKACHMYANVYLNSMIRVIRKNMEFAVLGMLETAATFLKTEWV